jgi:ABC-type ATPase with predicted acetyltransferase domain
VVPDETLIFGFGIPRIGRFLRFSGTSNIRFVKTLDSKRRQINVLQLSCSFCYVCPRELMAIILNLEEVYRTEGVPEYTFVKSPNYNEIFVDIRTAGKPVIVEGQSGTGKTTTVRKILESLPNAASYRYLRARRSEDALEIVNLSQGKSLGSFIVDDFHRLDDHLQADIANLVKTIAELWDAQKYPKIIIVGINKVGSELINLVHDAYVGLS